MLLSICIPAYNRPKQLKHCLASLAIMAEKCSIKDRIEVIITDDCSPNNPTDELREILDKYSFMRLAILEKNIGLEQNLINCSKSAKGEYLWIFGDDDFIENVDDFSNIVMPILENRTSDLIVMNRSRRKFNDLELITKNWMNIDEDKQYQYSSITDFYIDHGFLTTIGFISVNIMRRQLYENIDIRDFMDTMYPQLGRMSVAFNNKNVILIGSPIVCHRTQTEDEKKSAFKDKDLENSFMTSYATRNATYFGPYLARMLSRLVEENVFSYAQLDTVKERIYGDQTLINFCLANCLEYIIYVPGFASFNWDSIVNLIERFSEKKDAKQLLERYNIKSSGRLKFTIISPSYNQAEFVNSCMMSVKMQTYQNIEHIVFDPGSTDGSQAIVKSFSHALFIEEPDEGQSDCINKGYKKGTGDILCWLNSDDYYSDHYVIERVAKVFEDNPDISVVYGDGIYVDTKQRFIRKAYIHSSNDLLSAFQDGCGIFQPSLFIRKDVYHKTGDIDVALNYTMDYEYWIRVIKCGYKFFKLNQVLSKAVYHISSKTYGQRDKSFLEVFQILYKHYGYVSNAWIERYAEYKTDKFDSVILNSQNKGLNNDIETYKVRVDLFKRLNSNGHASQNYQVNRNESQSMLHELNETSTRYLNPIKVTKSESGSTDKIIERTIGNDLWQFNRLKLIRELDRWSGFVKKARDFNKGKTCVVVGNGPSLNKTILETLSRVDTIISNNAFLHKKLLRYGDIYTCVNYLVAQESSTQINMLNKIKILPYWLNTYLSSSLGSFWVEAKGFPEFSTDITKNISWRHTVTFYNLQVAVGLGYSKVILIGVDNSYQQPAGIKEGEIIKESKNDLNHFTPKYFKGKAWQAADTEKMSDMYALAKQSAEEQGVQIINCTEGGKLELFPRSCLQDEVSKRNKKTIHELDIDDSIKEGTIRDANSLFRNKKYDEALMIYNFLSKQNPIFEQRLSFNRYLSFKRLMQQNN